MKSPANSIIFLLFICVGSLAEKTAQSSLPQLPDNKEECLDRGGQWVLYPIGNFYFCALKTTDAGNSCNDGGECQGDCVPVHEFAKSGEASPGYCAKYFQMPGGCPVYIVDGKVVVKPCI